VPGNAEAVEAERSHRLRLVLRQGALRIGGVVRGRGRLRAVAVAAQIGDDEGELLGQARRHLAPHDLGFGIAVQQQQRRPTAADHQVDLGAGGLHPPLLEAGEEIGHLPTHLIL
jgi:hypothetical protein